MQNSPAGYYHRYYIEEILPQPEYEKIPGEVVHSTNALAVDAFAVQA